jgi:hypothetical protein
VHGVPSPVSYVPRLPLSFPGFQPLYRHPAGLIGETADLEQFLRGCVQFVPGRPRPLHLTIGVRLLLRSQKIARPTPTRTIRSASARRSAGPLVCPRFEVHHPVTRLAERRWRGVWWTATLTLRINPLGFRSQEFTWGTWAAYYNGSQGVVRCITTFHSDGAYEVNRPRS